MYALTAVLHSRDTKRQPTNEKKSEALNSQWKKGNSTRPTTKPSGNDSPPRRWSIAPIPDALEVHAPMELGPAQTLENGRYLLHRDCTTRALRRPPHKKRASFVAEWAPKTAGRATPASKCQGDHADQRRTPLARATGCGPRRHGPGPHEERPQRPAVRHAACRHQTGRKGSPRSSGLACVSTQAATPVRWQDDRRWRTWFLGSTRGRLRQTSGSPEAMESGELTPCHLHLGRRIHEAATSP